MPRSVTKPVAMAIPRSVPYLVRLYNQRQRLKPCKPFFLHVSAFVVDNRPQFTFHNGAMTSPAGKLLVALQYCANDAIEAFDLVNLILDLRHNTMTEPCWELLFYRSPDAPDPPADLQLRLDHQGIVWASASSGVTVNGWPMGPNATWQSLVHLLVGNPVIHPECRHVLCAEPDSSPMRRDWAEALFAEHLLGVEQGLVFSGHKTTTAVGTSPHVNGNLIFDRKGLDKLPTELYLEMLKETKTPFLAAPLPPPPRSPAA